jgi:hypothetical protein
MTPQDAVKLIAACLPDSGLQALADLALGKPADEKGVQELLSVDLAEMDNDVPVLTVAGRYAAHELARVLKEDHQP